MNIVIFSHPAILGSKSMDRFSAMLGEGMTRLGHSVEIWTASKYFSLLPAPGSLKKWLGYIDQFLVFPILVKIKILGKHKNTLYVISDNGLGPWVRLVYKKPHVVHCHDFLALFSARNVFPENATSSTGKVYQNFILNGYLKANNFISVSNSTRDQLEGILKTKPQISEVVYNAVDERFKVQDSTLSRTAVAALLTNKNLDNGYILHIGASVWYKNKKGVVTLYNEWRKITQLSLPLLMVGKLPDADLLQEINQSPFKSDFLFLEKLSDEEINHCYSGASLLIFPSLYEGFGWPIAEAMASGSMVLTTDEAPMTEVGGKAAFYIPRMKSEAGEMISWAKMAALKVDEILHLSPIEKEQRKKEGLEQIKKFDPDQSMIKISEIYSRILNPVSNS